MTADAVRRRALWQILLLGAGLLVLVAISATSVILVNQARKDSSWVVHTVEVENQLSTLLLEIRRAESSARGYLLTQQSRFLTEHEAAIAAIVPGLDKLESQTTDNPFQIANARKLRSAVIARLSEFGRAIDLVKKYDVRTPGIETSVGSLSGLMTALPVS